MAMSLNSDAWGRLGQNWFAAQKRKAAASRMVLTSSATGRRCSQLKNHVGEGDHRQGKRGENLVTPRGKQPRSSILNKEQHHAGQRDDAENQRNQPAGAVSKQSAQSIIFRRMKGIYKGPPVAPTV